MDQVIEPGTAELTTIEPPAHDPAPTEFYTLLDNGEFQPVMEVLYPAGTKFYAKNPDGSYVETGTQPEPEISNPSEITLEYMIEKSTEFLIQNGYHVFPPGDKPVQVEFESLNADLKTQISQLKDQLAAAQKPVKPGDRAVEASIRFAKMRSMIGSHFPTQALQNEANSIITELEAFF